MFRLPQMRGLALRSLPGCCRQKENVGHHSGVVNAVRSIWVKGGQVEFRWNFSRIRGLEEAENKAIFVENCCTSKQIDKRQCLGLLLDYQHSLEEVHSKIDPMPTQSDCYAALMLKEVDLLKKIRALFLDFHLYDKINQENLKSFSLITSECLSVQKDSEKQILNSITIASLVSLALGSLAIIVFFSVKSDASIKGEQEGSGYSNIIDGVSWIQRHNNKLMKCLKEMWAMFGINLSYTSRNQSFDGNFENEKGFISDANIALTDIFLENKALLQEMVTTESAVSGFKQFKGLPELIFSKDTNNSEGGKGLWLTTLAYGSAAVITPIFLLFFK